MFMYFPVSFLVAGKKQFKVKFNFISELLQNTNNHKIERNFV